MIINQYIQQPAAVANIRLNFDGADGSTVIIDEAGASLPAVYGGDAHITTAVKWAGAGSLQLNGGRVILDDPSGVPDVGDFGIQMRARRDGASATDRLFLFGAADSIGGNGSRQIWQGTDGILRARLTTNDGITYILVGPECPSGWFHAYLARYGNLMIFAIDGAVVSADIGATPLRAIAPGDFAVGGMGAAQSTHLGEYGVTWAGQIDNFVVTPYAPWWENFSPPSTPV